MTSKKDISRATWAKFEKEYVWGIGRVSDELLKELNIPLKYNSSIHWIENGSKILLVADAPSDFSGEFFIYLCRKDGKRACEILSKARNEEINEIGIGNNSDADDYGFTLAYNYLENGGDIKNLINFY
jgi:hypothetical protein